MAVVVVIKSAFLAIAIIVCLLVAIIEKLDSCTFYLIASATPVESEVWITRELE